jgi:hypothetical protein
MSKVADFNMKVARKITAAVSTMWCAYAFALLALLSLPAAIRSGDLIIIVAWIAQTFLQLVLLSIIMVGQEVQSRDVAQKISETHMASLGEFELAKEAQAVGREELIELKAIAKEIHTILRNIEKKA